MGPSQSSAAHSVSALTPEQSCPGSPRAAQCCPWCACTGSTCVAVRYGGTAGQARLRRASQGRGRAQIGCGRRAAPAGRRRHTPMQAEAPVAQVLLMGGQVWVHCQDALQHPQAGGSCCRSLRQPEVPACAASCCWRSRLQAPPHKQPAAAVHAPCLPRSPEAQQNPSAAQMQRQRPPHGVAWLRKGRGAPARRRRWGLPPGAAPERRQPGWAPRAPARPDGHLARWAACACGHWLLSRA